MKLQRLLLLFLIMLFTAPLVSCSDDDDEAPSKRMLLTEREWTGSALYIGSQNISDRFIDEDDPQNSFDVSKWAVKFNTDGTYSMTYDGNTVQTGMWEFANNEQEIQLDKGTPDAETAKINRLTNDELYLEMPWDMGNNLTANIEARFKR
jgi:hypothetical protein